MQQPPSIHVQMDQRGLEDRAELPAYDTLSLDPSLEEETELDDGRLEINANSRLFKTLSRIATKQQQGILDLSHIPEHPPNYSKHPPCTLKLNICIQVVGSRGDVQPFVALGTELARHGHRVRLATHDVFESFVRGSGLDFFPAGGDPAELMAYMVKNPGLIPSMKSVKEGDVKKKRKMIAEMLDGFWAACIEPDLYSGRPFVADAIIANPPSFAHVHCAQALGVPLHMMFTMPWSRTKAFPHPLVSLDLVDSTVCRDSAFHVGVANHVSYLAVEWLTWQGLGDVVNTWRSTLDLDPVPRSEGPLLLETLRVPFTYCWSAALVPKPDDWPEYIDVCGFFFRDEPKYTPDPELADFLERGPPPIYIGFGSIVIEHPARLTGILVEAVRETGVRAIISRGWSNLGEDEDPDPNILYLGDCPHEWLFKRVAAVIHHGGAGTTACGLLNERPTAIVPFFGDQPFWGDMVAAAAAGPLPIPHRKLTAEKLAGAIRYCLSFEARGAAADMAAKMKSEHGVRDAVASFQANLPAEEDMRCDLLPCEVACWTYRKGYYRGVHERREHRHLHQHHKHACDRRKVRLSRLAAEILLHNGEIRPNQLERYEVKPIDIYNHRWGIITATTASLASTGVDMARSTADIVVKPVEAIHEAAKARRFAEAQAASAASSSLSVSGADPVSATATASQGVPRSSGSSTLSTTSSGRYSSLEKRRAAKSQQSTFVKAVTGSAGGVGGFFHYMSKGLLVDMPLAATEGLRSVPKMYGSEVPEHGKVKDWKSGAVVAGKNFEYGIVHGFGDLVNEPVKGAREEGALGAVKGVGKGFVNMTTKVSSGVLGLVAYSGQGLMKTVVSVAKDTTRRQIDQAVREEGDYIYNSAREKTVDEEEVIRKFHEISRKSES